MLKLLSVLCVDVKGKDMGYFDGLVDGSFKTAQDGATLFYPNGIYGKGYIVPSVRKKQEIRESLKRHTIMALITTIGSAWIIFSLMEAFSIPIWIAGAVYIAIMAGLSFTANEMIRELTEGLASTEQRISVVEICRNSAQSHDLVTLWALGVISLLLVVGGAILSMDGFAAWHMRFVGLFSIFFFGACTLAIGYMIRLKKQA
jgi:hypothetical protein